MNDVTYNADIQNMIISHLDGWKVEGEIPVSEEPQIEEPVDETETVEETQSEETATDETQSETETSTGVDPFMTSREVYQKPNKVITVSECKMAYEETLDMAYMHTNRLNIDDLTEVEARFFIRGVCKWTASNLWNKYNIRVNNEDMEDTYVQSYGGLLYKSALKTLQPFINQRISGMVRTDEETDDNDIWIV
jgi:hypothetical protein